MNVQAAPLHHPGRKLETGRYIQVCLACDQGWPCDTELAKRAEAVTTKALWRMTCYDCQKQAVVVEGSDYAPESMLKKSGWVSVRVLGQDGLEASYLLFCSPECRTAYLARQVENVTDWNNGWEVRRRGG